jgi:UDP-glucose 4-epimerase
VLELDSGGRQRRVLVTGGFGFVGAHLCRQLVESGSAVAALDDCRLGSPANLAPNIRGEVEEVICDIRDTDGVAEALRRFRPDVVVHLAAIHFIPLCNARPRLAIDVNVGGTQSVLDACDQVDAIQGIVFASTGAVYRPSDEALSEDSPRDPSDIYGLTKLWGEGLIARERAKLRIGVAVARLFNVYGPRETNPHFIPVVLEQARRGAELQLGNLTTRRDYVYAEDTAAGLSAMVRQVTLGAPITCNLGTGRAIAGTEILGCVERVVGRRLVVHQDASRLRESDRPVLLSNSTAARKLIGWTARTGLEAGLASALLDPLATGVTIA